MPSRVFEHENKKKGKTRNKIMNCQSHILVLLIISNGTYFVPVSILSIIRLMFLRPD